MIFLKLSVHLRAGVFRKHVVSFVRKDRKDLVKTIFILSVDTGRGELPDLAALLYPFLVLGSIVILMK